MSEKKKKLCIGERIKEVFDQKTNFSISDFAKSLHCTEQNIYNIFRRKKIEIELLIEISKALDHDFIEEICAEHDISRNKPFGKISIVLEINTIDTEKLNTLIKLLKQLDIKSIQKIP